MKNYFTHLHYRKSFIVFLLLPFSFVYLLIIKFRKFLYQKNIFAVNKIAVPVIVVGNITLGGTGKTPIVIYLIELLKKQGHQPGVVSRGYGACALSYPYQVSEKSLAKEVGDEPLLIYLRTRAPVVVDPFRSRAAKYLLQNNNCSVIISDDGLQHYALRRDIEIAVVDSIRSFGNNFLFPAGPLREPISRLKQVDFIIINGKKSQENQFAIKIIAKKFFNLANPEQQVEADYFNNKKIIAIAGIGNPERFFKTLSELGIKFLKQPMPDHYQYEKQDLNFSDDVEIIMTEKDGVKAKVFASSKMWYLPISIDIENDFGSLFLAKLIQVRKD